MEYIVCLAVYLLIMVGVSVYAKKKTKSVNDFALGGRSIPPWMSAFSYGTAYFSAVILIGHAGKNGWTYGTSAFWIVVGNSIIGTLLAWKILGGKTREMTQRLNVATMPQFIATRYKDEKLRFITSAIIFIFLVPYAASVYKGLGFLFEITFNIDQRVIMIIMTLVTAFYLFAGGFLAASIADFIQGCIMIVGIALLVFYVLTYGKVDGIANGLSGLKAINPDLIAPMTKNTAVPLISIVVMTSFGTWGLPQMISKFYTIKSEKFIPTATIVSTLFAVLVTTGAYTMGSMSRLILNNEAPTDEAGNIIYDKIIPLVLNQDGLMPTIVLAVLLIVILAASMSTLASLVLASSTTFVMDLVKPAMKKDISDKQTVLLLRICCLVFIAAAYILATGNSPILNLNALSWGVVSGCLLAPYMLGLYWKRVTRSGVYISMISAGVIMIGAVAKFGISSPYISTASAVAIIAPIGVLTLASLVTTKMEDAHVAYIFNSGKVKEME